MKNKISSITLIIIGFLTIQAQTCCSGGIPLSNNLGLPSSEKGTFLIGLNYDYNNLNTLNRGTDNLNDDSRLRITHSALLSLGYSITERLSFETLLTWINQRRKISQFENENLDQTTGMGDAVLLIKYNFPKFLGSNSVSDLGIGTKIPLGSSTETNDSGIIYNADLQPGSNAWDLIFYSLFVKSFDFDPLINFYSRIFYRNTGRNSEYQGDLSYKYGNEFQVFLGANKQFLISKMLVSPGLSFKYRKVENDEINGFEIANTGGLWVFIIPDLTLNLNPNLSFISRAELPILSNVEGTQLTPTYRVTFGFLIRFIQKQKLMI